MPESEPITATPLWNTLKNAISKKPKATVIESAERYFDHLKNTEFCFVVTDGATQGRKNSPIGPDQVYKALKGWQLGFIRVVGSGRLGEPDDQAGKPRPNWRVLGMRQQNEAPRSPDAVEVNALLIYNAQRGSGATIPAFGEKMRELAQQNGLSSILHGLRAGPIKLIEVTTGKTLKIYPNFQDAAPDYLARVKSGFQLASIHRELSRPKATFMIAHIVADRIGEMRSLAEFTPARFSEDFELLTERLHNDKVEMGFVAARESAAQAMLNELKADAVALDMTWHELGLVDASTEGQVVGRPFLLVTMKGRRNDLREKLNDLAVKHRQDRALYAHRDGAIELISPYHDKLVETYVDLHAGLRAYLGTLFQLPVVQVRIVS